MSCRISSDDIKPQDLFGLRLSRQGMRGGGERVRLADGGGSVTGAWDALLEETPLVFFAWDPADFRLLAWNRAAGRMFAAAGREARGARLHELPGLRVGEGRLREIVSDVRAKGAVECALVLGQGCVGGDCATRWYSCGVPDDEGGLQAVLSIVETVPGQIREWPGVLQSLGALVGTSWSTVEELCREAVRLVAADRARPAIAGVRVSVGGREFVSEGFRPGAAVQAVDVAVDGEKAGVLEIHYVAAASGRSERALRRGDRELLRVVAACIGAGIGRLRPQGRREGEERLAQIVRGVAIPLFVIDRDHKIVHWNKACESLLGRSAGEMVGTTNHRTLPCFQERPMMADLIVDGAPPRAFDEYYRGAWRPSPVIEDAYEREEFFPALGEGGRWLHFSAAPIRNAAGEVTGAIETVQDITEFKRAAEALRESEHKALALASFREHVMRTATVWMNLLDTQGNITSWNEEAERISGYSAAEVVGHARVWEWLYPDEQYRAVVLESARRIIDGLEEDRDFETSIRCKNGSTRIIAWNSKQLTDARGQVVGSIAIGRDVTEYRLTQERLNQSFLSMAATIVEIFNLRDPYTADHSRGVAYLAREVGKLLGVSPDQLNALWVGGILHDLGKLGVPEMLLVKPGRLSEAERALIKEHTRLGYQVLKTAGFPWPVAEVALQHHERVDGSGCPEGLVGDDIVWEAKVIGICDVADAMLSRRPYRDARTVTETIREIARHRGSRYDSSMADALLELIRSGRHRPG